MVDCLVIDDSRLARRVSRIMLEKFGHQVAEAEDGQVGLQALEAGRFDMILVDQNMPGVAGIDFIKQVRHGLTACETIIILCSSDANPRLVRFALRHGANAYLNKPFTAGALGRRLKRLQIAPTAR